MKGAHREEDGHGCSSSSRGAASHTQKTQIYLKGTARRASSRAMGGKNKEARVQRAQATMNEDRIVKACEWTTDRTKSRCAHTGLNRQATQSTG